MEALKEQLAARDAALAEKDALVDSLREQLASQPPTGTSGVLINWQYGDPQKCSLCACRSTYLLALSSRSSLSH